MKRIQHRSIVILAGLVFLAGPASAQVTSKLWGASGEAWDPTNSILPNVSTVGYSNGLVAIPDWPVGVNVTNFGAVPNDELDDSQALIDAISNCPNYSAVFVPKGRYVIEQRISPKRDHFVLRGEDMYETVLFCPKHLNEIYINQKGWSPEGRNVGVDKGFFRVEGGTERSIENLSFEFREERKMGHWENKGASAISYHDDATHSWIRNIYMKNGDNVLILERASQLSVINVVLDHYIGRPDADYGDRRFVGHEGIALHATSRSLIHNARLNGAWMHGVDLNDVPGRNVVSRYRIERGVVHHHGGWAHHNLYTDMNCGVAAMRDDKGNNHETHWGLDAEVDDDMYSSTKTNLFVGYGNSRPEKITENIWYEPIDPAQLSPRNIYLAQLEYFNMPLPEGPPPPIPSPYEGEVVRINPTDDHHLTSDPDEGPGSLYIPVSGSPYFKFDLTGIDLSSVAHARLRINLTPIRNAPFELGAWLVNDDNWSEDTLTPENHPEAVSQLDSILIEAGRAGPRVEFDVTPFVQDQLAKGDPVITLCVKKTSGNGFLTSIRSSENGLAPELVIERVASSVPGAPSAPKGIGSTPLIGNIILDWDDNPESDVATYKVYRTDSYTDTGLVGAGLVTSDFVDTRSQEGFSVGMMDHRKVYTYWITAMDDHGYESARTTIVAATVHPSNAPPAFSSTVSLENATARAGYSENLSGAASDAESDPMYFMKVSGPDWLNVTLDGTLSGTPDLSDVGSNQFTFQVTAIGGSTQKVVNITVMQPVDDPAGAPAAPSGLNAAVDNRLVSLSWSNNAEADLCGYNLYRSTSSGSLGALLTTVVGTNAYTDITVTNGTTYYYTLKAVDTGDNESGGAQASAVPVDSDPAPAAPASLTATAGDYFVDLAWDAGTEGDLAGYTIYRTGLSGTYCGDPIAVNVTEPTYRDNTANNETLYYYAVTAVDAGGHESPRSNEDSAVPSDIAPEAPTGLFAMARDGEVYLHWNESTDVDLAGYRVYRSTASGTAGSAITGTLTSNAWSDDTVNNGTTYYYTLSAVDESGQQSAPGEEASATPQAGLLTTLLIGDAVSGAANNWINNSTNWDAGLPVGGPQGLITIDAKYSAPTTLQGYDVVQRAGYVSNDGINKLYMAAGTAWLIDGSTAGIYARGMIFDNSQFTLNNGDANFSGNSKETKVTGSSGRLTVNGGTLTVGPYLYIENGGTLIVNGGTLKGSHLNVKSGIFELNGGTITADDFMSDAAYTTTFGGTAEGSLKLLSGPGTVSTLDWLPGTKMSMTVAASNEWAEALWDAGTLTYNGQSKTDLGKTWAQVTATDGLETGANFDYDSDTETLTLSFEFVEDTTPPAKPVGLNAAPGNGQVTLTWTANTELNLAGYSVYRSTLSSNYTGALVTGLSSSAYVDTDVTNGTTYCYVVTATDNSSNESVPSAEISVIPDGANQAPVADAGADQTVTDSDENGSESVTLDGSGSSDPDGTIVSYVWAEGGSQIATGFNPSVSLAVGVHTITLTVTDNDGATGSDTLEITVADLSSGGTVFLGGDIATAGNWDNGLPSAANPGIIGVSGNIPEAGSPLVDYYVTQTNGTINNAHFTGTAHSGGEWILTGGTYSTRSMSIIGAGSFVVNGGTASLGNNDRDVNVSGGSTFTITAGTTTLGRSFYLNGSTFTISGGTLTGDGNSSAGSSSSMSPGQMNFNGGDTALYSLKFDKDGTVATFGGSSTGSVTVDSLTGIYISLNWLPGTEMTLSATNMTDWAATLWAADQLAYNGNTSSDLGLDWAAVTSTGFGDGAKFVYDSGTKTLSLNSPSLQGYDQWATEWGTDIGAATNDMDADGLSNFGEYAFGGDPTNALVHGTAPILFKSGNGFLYVHPQRSDYGTITYLVETTTNLITGVWTNSGVIAIGTNVTGGSIDFVTNDVGIVENEKFIRLKVEK